MFPPCYFVVTIYDISLIWAEYFQSSVVSIYIIKNRKMNTLLYILYFLKQVNHTAVSLESSHDDHDSDHSTDVSADDNECGGGNETESKSLEVSN